MPVLQSVASNVESTLAFTLSVKIVDIIDSMNAESSSGASGVHSFDPVLTLCTVVVFMTLLSGFGDTASGPKGHATTAKPTIIQAGWSKDLRSIATHVLVLAFSRMAMKQIKLSSLIMNPNAPATYTFFVYARRVVEIVFIIVLLSCALTTILPMLWKKQPWYGYGKQSQLDSGSLVNRQLNSLTVNMQRTFAETVASLIPDDQTRKMIVLLGLCMLPMIAHAVGAVGDKKNLDIRSIESFFLLSAGKRGGSKTKVYSNFLWKLWIAALSLAWMNTALSFVLPSEISASSKMGSLNLWIRLLSTVCIAILSRALQPMFAGLGMFQGYIEWSIASGLLLSIKVWSVKQETSLGTVVCTGLAFLAFDALHRDFGRLETQYLQRDAMSNQGKITALHLLLDKYRVSTTLQTFQSISTIMFTNSFVSFAMEQVASFSGKSQSELGNAFAAVVAGLVVSRTIVQILDQLSRGSSS